MDVVITQIKVQPAPEPDRRYRMQILLQRSDRPRYYVFHCPLCGTPACELVNSDVLAISDTMDFQNTDLMATGLRCDGRINGQNCRIWLYFKLA